MADDFSDGFSCPRERIEAYPTMMDYCLAQSDDALVHLILPGHHQGNVFATYKGTQGQHARDIIKAIRKIRVRTVERAPFVFDEATE